MPTLSRCRAALIALSTLAAGACDPEPARLAIELDGPIVADPLVFHGNCLAGWSVRGTLRVRETGGAGAWMDTLTYAIRDEGREEDILAETLDAASIKERHGTRYVPARSAVLLAVSGPSGNRPQGPVTLLGELRAHDEDGKTLQVSYRLEASSLVVHDPELDPGGACRPASELPPARPVWPPPIATAGRAAAPEVAPGATRSMAGHHLLTILGAPRYARGLVGREGPRGLVPRSPRCRSQLLGQ